MSAIDVSKCPKNIPVKIYDANDELIVETDNDLVFNWVCAEIKEKQLSGCYIIFQGEKIRVDRNGTPECYPDGLFEHLADQLFRLC